MERLEKKKKTTEMVTVSFARSTLHARPWQASAPRLTHMVLGSAWNVCPRRRSRPPDSRSRRQPSGQSPPFISPQSSREPLSLRPCFSGRPPRLKNAGITCAESWHGGRRWQNGGGAWPGDTDAASNCKSKQMKGGET